jgi:hypothetical protein
MKPALIWGLVLLAATLGCGTHSYQVRPDGVELRLVAPHAEQVEFACSLDRFTPRKASKTGRGKWIVTVSGAESFRYFYRVDGKLFIPDCRLKEIDDFGSQNCIYQPGM